WDFAGEPIPSDLCADLTVLHQMLSGSPDSDSPLPAELGKYLTAAEISALARRAERLVKSGRYPNPDPDRRPYPWPPV
ncbi:MAG: SCO1664 family protein, partial [Anaerolineales bacterium]